MNSDSADFSTDSSENGDAKYANAVTCTSAVLKKSFVTSTPKKEFVVPVPKCEEVSSFQDIDEGLISAADVSLISSVSLPAENTDSICTSEKTLSGEPHKHDNSFQQEACLKCRHCVFQPYSVDIPVSPDLKSRVRQRLFNLVNSIDGYTPQASSLNIGHQMSVNDSRVHCITDCATALSSLIKSQMTLLQKYQCQIYEDKFDLECQKKEEEVEARLEYINTLEERLQKLSREKQEQSEAHASEIINLKQNYENKLLFQEKQFEEKARESEVHESVKGTIEELIKEAAWLMNEKFQAFFRNSHMHTSKLFQMIESLKAQKTELEQSLATLSLQASHDEMTGGYYSHTHGSGESESKCSKEHVENVEEELEALRRKCDEQASNLASCKLKLEAAVREKEKETEERTFLQMQLDSLSKELNHSQSLLGISKEENDLLSQKLLEMNAAVSRSNASISTDVTDCWECSKYRQELEKYKAALQEQQYYTEEQISEYQMAVHILKKAVKLRKRS